MIHLPAGRPRRPAGPRPHDTSGEGAEMTTPTDERCDLLTVIAHMRAEPGREQ